MDFIAEIKEILSRYYHIRAVSAVQIQGGWSALAYLIQGDGGKRFILKVYEKSRASTSKLTYLIDDYVPILKWLNLNTDLSGKISNPVQTKQGANCVETPAHIFMLLEYVEGSALGDKDLEPEQVVELAGIVAGLHSHGSSLPVPVTNLKENFDITFCESLLATIHTQENLSYDLKPTIIPYKAAILRGAEELKSLSTNLKTMALQYVLCHTDIHGGNIIGGTDNIVLIDWEGLKLAPAEADLFGLASKPWFCLFFERYHEKHPDYRINEAAILFYRQRRVLEDIWEFVEQLQYDNMNSGERAKALNYLKQECGKLVALQSE